MGFKHLFFRLFLEVHEEYLKRDNFTVTETISLYEENCILKNDTHSTQSRKKKERK